jgi:glycosyltransferase involved in cell wall biosynthesis
VGGVGCEFFERIGFPREKIVPFGYYLAVPPVPATQQRPADHVFRFISAGQLIHRKGIDLLLRACASLPRSGWRLDIYGDGPARSQLERFAARLGLASHVAFHGAVPNDAVRQALAHADCAVLPSRFDGWGMLVNESLAAGTPVICTNQCGAAALPPQCGLVAVAPAATRAAIAEALSLALTAGPSSSPVRANLAAVIEQRGSAPAAARRMLFLLSAA